MKYFDGDGRRVPTETDRVFGEVPNKYYKLAQPELNYKKILDRSRKFNISPSDITSEEFQEKAEGIVETLKSNSNFSNLLLGVHVPFVFIHPNPSNDLGTDFEDVILSNLKDSFSERYEEAHFKAVLQGDSKLCHSVSLDPSSRYHEFMNASRKGVVGWYFPQALQEYDINSQRGQMSSLPELQDARLCLSGGMDIGAALIGTPELLINENFYTPILCMSAFKHSDERLILLLKAYGPHLEFWCMTQMLSKHTTQVSEQWAGGFTIFTEL